MINNIKLSWDFYCKAREIDNDKSDFLANNRGVYLWIYKNDVSKRVVYVGKASAGTFKKRMKEHYQLFFGGGYPAYRIPPEVDYLRFIQDKEILTKKIGDSGLIKDPDIIWYRNFEENYFQGTFFDDAKKRMEIVTDYFNHLEFSFATILNGNSNKDLIPKAENILGRRLHDFYMEKITGDEKIPSPIFPSGNRSDTIVGRHPIRKELDSIDLIQEGESVKFLPFEVLYISIASKIRVL